MKKLDRWMRLPSVCVLALTISLAASAQTYEELLSFNGNSAAGPLTPLTQGFDGSLYGTTYYGGTGTCFDNEGIGCGVVFKLTRGGEFRVIYNFQDNGIYYPVNGLTGAQPGEGGTSIRNLGTRVHRNH